MILYWYDNVHYSDDNDDDNNRSTSSTTNSNDDDGDYDDKYWKTQTPTKCNHVVPRDRSIISFDRVEIAFQFVVWLIKKHISGKLQPTASDPVDRATHEKEGAWLI